MQLNQTSFIGPKPFGVSRAVSACRLVLAAALTLSRAASRRPKTPKPAGIAAPAKPRQLRLRQSSRSNPVHAAKPVAEAGPQAVPGFWDPRRRPDRPDLSRLTVIRFLTETDYPPFNFTGPDGNPAGFNVDLARMICDEIKVTCTVQMRRFETLLDAISSNRGDAIIASLAVTPQLACAARFQRSLLPCPGPLRVAEGFGDAGDQA